MSVGGCGFGGCCAEQGFFLGCKVKEELTFIGVFLEETSLTC